MVKLTGSVRLVLFIGNMAVKTSESISVLFSVLKYSLLRRLSIPVRVMKAAAAEPDQITIKMHVDAFKHKLL